MIDFDLPDEDGIGSPDPSAGVPRHHFSARWTGTIQPPDAANRTLLVKVHGSVVVIVEGQHIIDLSASGDAQATASASIAVDQPSQITVEYRNGDAPASLHVLWSAPGGAEAAAVTPIVPKK